MSLLEQSLARYTGITVTTTIVGNIKVTIRKIARLKLCVSLFSGELGRLCACGRRLLQLHGQLNHARLLPAEQVATASAWY